MLRRWLLKMPSVKPIAFTENTPPFAPLKIHWRLCQGGGDHNRSRAAMQSEAATALPDLKRQLEFARAAERIGVDSLLVDFGYNKPDSIVLSTALGVWTEKIKLIVACRSGLMSPTVFVQQINTLSVLTQGRVALNIVAGHTPHEQRYYGDFMTHNQRFFRTGEYVAVCRALWRDGVEGEGVNFSGKYYRIKNAKLKTPFIGEAGVSETASLTGTSAHRRPALFVAGSSVQAQVLAKKLGDIWVCVAEAPAALAEKIRDMRRCGVQVALRLSIICRPTYGEAVAAAGRLLEQVERGEIEKQFVRHSDSIGIKRAYKQAAGGSGHWLTPCLWIGAVKTHGAPSIALVGDPEQIVAAIMQYRQLGVSQLILSGWPQYEEMCRFGKYIMPLIRERERKFLDAGNFTTPEFSELA